MPYTHKKVGSKFVVYKKGKKVGETEGTKTALNKYLAALHIADKKTAKKESIKESADQPVKEVQRPEMVDEVGSFWVVTRPNQQSTMEDVVFESSVLHFANQIRGGLYEDEVIGLYKDEAKAVKTADQLIAGIQNKLKEIENKKVAVTSKIEETIKKLQKEVNRCMEEGDDAGAQQRLQKISELRSKSQMVEASKKPIEEKKDKK
jgi:hypothetical protein